MRTIDTLPLAAQLNQSSLDGRVILITGAAGGIGKALSLACARAGATVVLHGRVVRKLEALYDEIMRNRSSGMTRTDSDIAGLPREVTRGWGSAAQHSTNRRVCIRGHDATRRR